MTDTYIYLFTNTGKQTQLRWNDWVKRIRVSRWDTKDDGRGTNNKSAVTEHAIMNCISPSATGKNRTNNTQAVIR